MNDDESAELTRWRMNVDDFIAESNLYRRGTAIRMEALEGNLEKNTTMTEQMHAGLSEVIPVLQDLKGTARTAKRLGGMLTARPVMLCVGLVAATIAYFKTGKWEWPSL